IYHAIIGSLEQVGLATVIAVPVGVLTAIYLVAPRPPFRPERPRPQTPDGLRGALRIRGSNG
ncbi:hypothetical protein, partial [Streptomyces sp. NPDC050704]|uniref:hypothetical protein n=1 Tax=Streptomyces sp. NPDC050704 TaxID=3157219 RepID=UPI00343C2CFF